MLKLWLTGDNANGFSMTCVAKALGMSSDAIEVAIHRLRKTVRTLAKAEAIESNDEAENSIELDDLIRTLEGC